MNELRHEPRGAATSSQNAADVASTATKRRFLFLGAAGAAAVGALSAGASVHAAPQDPGTQSDAAGVPERGGGYQLSEHVKRYYRSTTV